MDSRPIQGMGIRRAHRNVQRAVSDAERAPAGDARADEVHAPSCRSRPGRGSDVESEAEQLPTYNAYSIDGDVTAPLVYVNYGMPEDYEQLDRLGISVKGAIVIARYGEWLARRQTEGRRRTRSHRLHHLLRSEGTTDTPGRRRIPKGLRPAEGVQRGSVMDMPITRAIR